MLVLGVILLFFASFTFAFINPLHHLLGVSNNWDRVFAAIGLVGTVYLLINQYMMPRMLSAEMDLAPCGIKSWQARCYDIEQKVCSDVWEVLEMTCREEIKPEMEKLGPTALIGPKLKRCQEEKFDKMFKFKRKQIENSTQCVPK